LVARRPVRRPVQAHGVREQERPALDREHDRRGLVGAPVRADDLPVLRLEPRLEVPVALLGRAGVRAAVRVLEVLLAQVVQPHDLRERAAALGAPPPEPREQAALGRRFRALDCSRIHLALLSARGWAAPRPYADTGGLARPLGPADRIAAMAETGTMR